LLAAAFSPAVLHVAPPSALVMITPWLPTA
jgi:hypothetical protein